MGQIINKSEINSTGKTISVKAQFVNDISSGSREPVHNDMIAQNMIAYPVRTQTLVLNAGNIIQKTGKDGVPTTYLEGYNGQYLVAEITNASYSQIEGILTKNYIDNLVSSNNPNISAINNLRNNPNLKDAMITTYTYKPLVGVTSVTDPIGKITTYEYDVFNRLKHIKDLNGNILERYDYHYQNEQ